MFFSNERTKYVSVARKEFVMTSWYRYKSFLGEYRKNLSRSNMYIECGFSTKEYILKYFINVNLRDELNIYREKVINTGHDCRDMLFLKEGVSLSERM